MKVQLDIFTINRQSSSWTNSRGDRVQWSMSHVEPKTTLLEHCINHRGTEDSTQPATGAAFDDLCSTLFSNITTPCIPTTTK